MRFSKKILTKAVQKALLENKRIRIFAFIFGQENQSKIHVGARPSPGSTNAKFKRFAIQILRAKRARRKI
mgnify:CR=1 FL=1